MKTLRVFFYVTFLLLATPACAATIVTATQALDFGSFFLRNNDAVYSATITPLGVRSGNAAFMFLGTAKNGAYSITGADPDMDLNVSFTPEPLTLTCSCPSPDFTLDTFTISPAIPHTTLAGTATFTLGATLLTSGTAAIYDNGAYSGTVTINFDY